MIEILILFELNSSVLTMYGISKEIKKMFSSFMLPSFGTIKPALVRLEANGFIKSQKNMSKGGRPSIYYSITNSGKEELKKLLLAEPNENPVQFLINSRVSLMCSDFLDLKEQIILISNIKNKAISIMYEAKNLIANYDLSYYPRVILDNRISEYKNFIDMLEGIEHACSR